MTAARASADKPAPESTWRHIPKETYLHLLFPVVSITREGVINISWSVCREWLERDRPSTPIPVDIYEMDNKYIGIVTAESRSPTTFTAHPGPGQRAGLAIKAPQVYREIGLQYDKVCRFGHRFDTINGGRALVIDLTRELPSSTRKPGSSAKPKP